MRRRSSRLGVALAGSWIPALVFGIPGDSVTAIVIGVLMMKNITPGPEIFTDPARATLVCRGPKPIAALKEVGLPGGAASPG